MSSEQAACAGRLVAGRYELCDLLGRGGMGAVWRAADLVLGRTVAVKEVTYPPYLGDDERRVLRERTLREARAAARFAHPKVTTVHDVVEEDGKPWIVMEHVRSRSLAAVLRDDGPLPPQRVARIGLDVLAALEAAHRAGIVHRDVKPANVLLDEEGQAWLTDFGIATSTGEASLTSEGVLLGSPAYLAPEHARGGRPGPAVDLWSLGATLCAAVEGRSPFERSEAIATLAAVMLDDPGPLLRAGPLAPVLRGLLEKDPARRWTAEQARDALALVAAAPPAAVPERLPTAPAARPPAPGTVGGLLQRLDLGELRAAVSERARETVRGSGVAAARTAAAGLGHAHAFVRSRAAHPAPPPAPERRRARRVRRRWVAVPLAVALLLFLLLVGLVTLVVWGLTTALTGAAG